MTECRPPDDKPGMWEVKPPYDRPINMQFDGNKWWVKGRAEIWLPSQLPGYRVIGPAVPPEDEP